MSSVSVSFRIQTFVLTTGIFSVTVDGLQGSCGHLTGTTRSFVAVSVTVHHFLHREGLCFVTVSVSLHVRTTSTGMYSVTLSILQGGLAHLPGTSTYFRLYFRNSAHNGNLFDDRHSFGLRNEFFFLDDERIRFKLRQNLRFLLNARFHDRSRKIISNCTCLCLGTRMFCAYNGYFSNLRLSCGVGAFDWEWLWDWNWNFFGNNVCLFNDAWLNLCMSDDFCESLWRTRFCSTCYRLSNPFPTP